MLCLRDTIRKLYPDLQELIENIEKQQTLAFIVLAHHIWAALSGPVLDFLKFSPNS